MRIQCPECATVLSLSQPKPGNYKPICKGCGKPFRLKISDDVPPKVTIARFTATPGPSPAPVHKPAPAVPRPGMSATVATIDSVAGGDPQRTSAGADATQRAGVDATVDGTLAGSQASAAASGRGPVVSQGGKASRSVVSAGGSAAKGRPAPPAVQPADGDEVPERLGGYRILRLLGRGAMGAVYEAKQVSLDRLVALKTIRGRLAGNPSSLARFTREAYAAAQLTHHNVVQIYDFGEDDGKHYFSMEWVRGGPLDQLVREKGAIDPKLAAGYILQAARGLQFAHRNGMVHRDIKPANLLLSDEGIVKVADLGLVKLPDEIDPESEVGALSGLESGTQVTMQGTAVGTPAYMAPEQGADAANVDHRADIYSLGCTMFYLLAGRPPFQGSVVTEVLEQHARQPLPSLAEINARVPARLEQIVRRSMAKRPDDRYPSLSEMIDDLESFLGVSHDGKFSPTSEQADKWEQITASYAAATPLLHLTSPLLLGWIGVSALLTLVLPFAGWGWLLFGPAMFLSAIVAALLLAAPGGPSPMVAHVRSWIGSLSWPDCGIGLLGAVVFLLVVLLAGIWPGLVAGGLLGAAAGAAYHYLLIAPSRRQQEPVRKDAERFIRDLRIGGADEEGVRSFAARYAGPRWQGIFEALFGYESLCRMREQLQGDPSFSGPTASLSWRDRICSSLAAKANANRQSRDLKRLAKIEQRGLQCEGVSAGDARERAWQMAAAVIDNAKVVAPAHANVDARAAAEEKRLKMKAMLAEARSGKYKKKRDPLAPLRFALGGQTRLLAGCLLLAVFAIWGNNQGLFDSFKDLQSLQQMDIGDVQSSLRENAAAANQAGHEPLLGSNPWSIGVAGLLLVMSAFVSGWRMTPFAVAATLVILFGPSCGVPGVGTLLQPWMVSALAGVALYLPGILFGESNGD
jgi:serine/threonine protein kinase